MGQQGQLETAIIVLRWGEMIIKSQTTLLRLVSRQGCVNNNSRAKGAISCAIPSYSLRIRGLVARRQSQTMTSGRRAISRPHHNSRSICRTEIRSLLHKACFELNLVYIHLRRPLSRMETRRRKKLCVEDSMSRLLGGDMMPYILSFLCWKEVMQTRVVCKAWKEAALETEVAKLDIERQGMARLLEIAAVATPKLHTLRFGTAGTIFS